ncbi:DUF262 domain-containing protein [Kribbella capetownensis]|uniref:DUF262 domain-containing protein n=1 Tax=Kribbella capetownensis TaxID=1572659 RepID=A0A4R0JCT8_9ACTN|nr:DUF262 domain-containing protein [Kribbella capetownensis]TCC44109.1 DUF262 domain-containing protein [Kribbella capetownensis]
MTEAEVRFTPRLDIDLRPPLVRCLAYLLQIFSSSARSSRHRLSRRCLIRLSGLPGFRNSKDATWGGSLNNYRAGFKRNPNTQAVSWFLDQQSARRLDLDPPYQRRSVWNVEYKQFFIDSIIRNYPAPTIFLQVEVSPGQPTTYHVIDGKQRLTALFEFVADEFQTPESLDDVGLGDVYFSELSPEVQVAILEYSLAVENISNASSTELNEAFDRLNRNVARLNKQELRHARFGGEFIKKVEGLAEHPFWTQLGIATPARIRRMIDVEYVSELYVISLAGTQEGKDYLEDFYAKNDREISNEEQADKDFLATQDFLRELDGIYALKATRFANIADFYSLWAAVTELIAAEVSLDVILAAGKLEDFAAEIAEQSSDRARDYLLASVQGSNKKANRELRTQQLKDVLTGR